MRVRGRVRGTGEGEAERKKSEEGGLRKVCG